MNAYRIILMAAISLVFTTQLFAQKNLISNGGFEDDSTGWHLLVQTGFAATVEYPTTGAPEGDAFARVKVTEAPVEDPDADNWKVQLQAPQWIATKNAIYKLAFKVKSTASKLKLGLNGAGGEYVDGFDIALDTAWQTRSCMFTSDTSGKGQLRINFYIGADTGVYEFDSVYLVKTGIDTTTNSLISNGGFELEGAGWGLYVQEGSGAQAEVSYPSSGAPEGTRYASVNVLSAGDMSQVQLQLPLFAVDSNTNYTVTYNAKGTGAIRVVSQYDASQEWAVKETFYQELAEEWATYSQTFSSDVTGNGALRINFYVGAVGTYDFDSVSVFKTESSIKNLFGKFSIHRSLTMRQSGNGVKFSISPAAAKGCFSIGIYSPSGRMVENIAGLWQSGREIFIPMNRPNGAYIVRFMDSNRKIVQKFFWLR